MPPPNTPEEANYGPGYAPPSALYPTNRPDTMNAVRRIQVVPDPPPPLMEGLAPRSRSRPGSAGSGARRGQNIIRPSSADSQRSAEVQAERRPLELDFANLEYVAEVDENLLCPICHLALYQPVTTKCGHTFCLGCLREAISIQPRCPIDRAELDIRRRSHVVNAPCLVSGLLDALRVKCPNRGCDHVSARSLIEHHYRHTCQYARIPCIDRRCDRFVLRMDAEAEECLHRDVKCVHCSKNVTLADLDEHYDTDCAEKTYRCEHCREKVARHKHDAHLKECKGRDARCRFHKMGCKFVAKNQDLSEHEDGCVYRAIFMHQKPLEDEMRAMNARLRNTEEELRLVKEDQRLASAAQTSANDHIAAFNAGLSDSNRATDGSVAAAQAASQGAPDSEFVMSMVENCESKVDNVEKYIREMDGRHSVMLLNELMPVKEQLTELRSSVGVMGMHVRWLMDHHRRKTTFQRVSAGAETDSGMAGPAGVGGPSGAGPSDDDSGRLASRRSHEGQAPRL